MAAEKGYQERVYGGEEIRYEYRQGRTGSPEVSESAVFTDVASDLRYSKAIAWAAENGIVNGYGNGSFGPEDSATREQMVCVLSRFAQRMGRDTSARADLSRFKDSGLISAYCSDAMRWAVANYLIYGVTEDALCPTQAGTRAQFATLLRRFCEILDL